MSYEVTDVFKHKGKICVVIKAVRGFTIGTYHNGYVAVQQINIEKSYTEFMEIDTVQLTFSGTLDHFKDRMNDISKFVLPKGIWFLGFDTVHAWNDEEPESKTRESVIEITKKLADEMLKRGV